MSNSANAKALIERYRSGVRDFRENDLRAVKFYGSVRKPISLVNIILQSANARGGIFSHVDLTDANLKRAHLQDCSFNGSIAGADFTEAELTNARLGPGKINNAVFFNSNLTNADFGANSNIGKKLTSSAKKEFYTNINFRGANLTNARLTSNFMGADFRDAQLTGAVFKEGNLYWYRATLSGANFQGVDLQEKDLSGLDLSGANLSGANLANADLTGSNLEEANLLGANLDGAMLDQSNLRGAQFDDLLKSRSKDYYAWEIQNQRGKNRDFHSLNLERLNLQECDLSNSNMSKANLKYANLSKTNLQDIQLNEDHLSYANLSSANIAGGDLRGICATHADFREANLQKTDLKDANLTNASLVKADLTDASLENADCKGLDLSGCQLHNTNFGNCILEDAIIYDVDFSQARDVPAALLEYLAISNSLRIRRPRRFRQISEEQHHTCINQYGEEAAQYSNYAIWFRDIPLLPSYQVPVSLLDKLFELSTIIQYGKRYISRFFFDSFFKPNDLFASLSPSDEEILELMKVSTQVFSPLEVFRDEIDSEYFARVQRPIIRKSSEEFAQWLVKVSGLQANVEELDEYDLEYELDEYKDFLPIERAPSETGIKLAAEELASLVGEEVAICKLNEGDHNENEQYSAYAVISRNYLIFILKYWEL